MATPKSVLISGGGVAGPVTGILLARLGWNVTIVERAPAPRRSGQQIDISGAALQVVRQMGLDDAIRKELVHDNGLKFVDASDRSWGSFAVKDTGDAVVKEYEILRSDLAGVLYDASRDTCNWIFGDTVQSVEQSEQDVKVQFDHSADQVFDVMVIADGLRSRTRGLIFDERNIRLRNLNLHGALFTIPWRPSDGTWSRWYSDVGGRSMVLRPQAGRRRTGAYLNVVGMGLQGLSELPVEEQKEEVRKVFAKSNWTEAQRMLDGAREAEDWYIAEAIQVYSKSIVKARVGLLGDAGFCPSPVSGQGTSIAITSAYILAGCLSEQDNVEEALLQYETTARPFIDAAQSLPPGVPTLLNPQSRLGVNVLYGMVWVVSLIIRSGLTTLFTMISSPFSSIVAAKEMKLPRYPALTQALPNS